MVSCGPSNLQKCISNDEDPKGPKPKGDVASTALVHNINETNQSDNVCEDQEKNQEKQQPMMQNNVGLKTHDNMLAGEDGIQAVNKEDILIEISEECISIPLGFEAQSLVKDDEDDIVE